MAWIPRRFVRPPSDAGAARRRRLVSPCGAQRRRRQHRRVAASRMSAQQNHPSGAPPQHRSSELPPSGNAPADDGSKRTNTPLAAAPAPGRVPPTHNRSPAPGAPAPAGENLVGDLPAKGRKTSDGRQLFLLRGEMSVHVLDEPVGDGLDLFLDALRIILGQLAFLLLLFRDLHRIAAGAAEGYVTLLGESVGDLDELLPPLAAQLRQGHADHAAIYDRINAEIGGLQRFFDAADDRLVPRSDLNLS